MEIWIKFLYHFIRTFLLSFLAFRNTYLNVFLKCVNILYIYYAKIHKLIGIATRYNFNLNDEI